MPRGVKRRSKARVAWTSDHRRQLVSGHQMFEVGFGRTHQFEPLDEEGARAAWAVLRDEILAEFTVQHPGQRPWAWWNFEAPEPRRWIPRRIAGQTWRFPETEAEYLARLGFLNEHERKLDSLPRVEPGWYAPLAPLPKEFSR